MPAFAQIAPSDTAILSPDASGPAFDAVASLGGCTAVLIAPDVALTAAHCVPTWRRQPQPSEADDAAACPALPQHAELARSTGEDPYRWYSKDAQLRIGQNTEAPLLMAQIDAYALPRCADMILLRLAEPVPAEIARPLPIMTHRQPSLMPPERRALRHASFAGRAGDPPPAEHRMTGPLRLWGANACVILAVPPRRADGDRLHGGDSGAPMLMRIGGEEVVAGILFSVGQPDTETCGTVTPRPRTQYGSWTPTYRGEIDGTRATPIGDWLRAMVPHADHR